MPAAGVERPHVEPQSFQPAVVRQILRLPVFAVLLVACSRGFTDTDIWGHLRFGLDWLATRHLPAVDAYSFTTDQLWVNHEWASQALFALAFHLAGLAGLALLRVTLGAALIAVVNFGLRRTPWPRRDLLLAAVVIGAVPQLSAVRPQFMSLVLYPTCLIALEQDSRWLPLVFAAWANLHGGWLIGLAAVLVNAGLRPSRQRAAVAACCVAATLVNPYGVRLWQSLVEAAQRGWSDVTEWRPLWAAPSAPVNLGLWLVVGLFALWCLIRGTRARPFDWVWTAATAAASLQARRHLPFFVMTAVLLIFSRVPAVPGRVPLVAKRARTAVLAGAFVLAVCAAAVAALWPTATCLPPIPEDVRPEPSSVRYLRSSGLAGRMVVYFDWGLYAIWQVGDRFKVSVDNRRETVYSARVIRDHDLFYAGKNPDYPRWLNADVVWLPATLPAASQLTARGWHLVFRGPRSVIFSRQFRPLTTGIASAPGCFPEP